MLLLSRLARARQRKAQSKTKARILVGGLLLVFAAAALYYYQFYGRPSNDAQPVQHGDLELIDLERTVALLDMFEHTHVSVFFRDGVDAEVVVVEGSPLRYDTVEKRWAGTFSDYRAGDSLILMVITTDDRSEEIALTVQALTLD